MKKIFYVSVILLSLLHLLPLSTSAMRVHAGSITVTGGQQYRLYVSSTWQSFMKQSNVSVKSIDWTTNNPNAITLRTEYENYCDFYTDPFISNYNGIEIRFTIICTENGIYHEYELYWDVYTSGGGGGGLNDGDTFYYSWNDIKMKFKVISSTSKTCMLGAGSAEENDLAVSRSLSIETLIVPETANGYKVTEVATCAFCRCKKIKKTIILPKTITKIGMNAFQDCDGLTSMTVPDNVKYIDDGAFSQCDNLEELTLGSSLEELGFQILWDSDNLKSLTSLSPIPPKVSSWGLGVKSDATLYVPAGCIERYKNATGWSSFTKIEKIGGGQDDILVTDITLNKTSLSLQPGQEEMLTATVKPDNATNKNVTWESSNTSVVTVKEGKVTAKAEGTCTITCKANDGSGKQATCSIIVKASTPTGIFTAKTVEGVEMTFYGYSDGTCYVYGTSSTPSIDINTSGKITIPSEVNGLKVVKINGNAFSDCSGITEVVVPNTVEEIGYMAFGDCSGLTSVQLGTDVRILGSYAFQDCTSLTSISLNNSVAKVDYKAFYGCTSLSTITGFSNLEYIGSSAFGETPWEDNLPDGQIYLGKVFYKYKGEMSDNTSFSFKNGTKAVAGEAFYNCKGLVAVTIPESVNSIKEGAFSGCDNLASIIVTDGNMTYDSRNNCNAIIETGTNTLVAGCKTTTIPGSVTKIGGGAFHRNGGITSMVIPNNIEDIGFNAFWHCDNLKSLVIGKGLKTVSNSAFWYCSNLQTISIVTDNPYFDSRDNCNAIIETLKDELVVGCQTTVIPNSVKSIGTHAFTGYNTIYSLVIPNSVEKISSTSFYQLNNLQTVVIGSAIKEIGEMAFYRCAKLEKIYSLIDFPFDINDNTFETTSWENYVTAYENAILYVPIGSKFNYMTCVGWGKFKNIVEFDPSTFDPSILGIHGVTLENDKDAPVFDLFGRKLAQPNKGINIIGGKKVIVK